MDRLDNSHENQSARADLSNNGLNSVDILSGQNKPSPLKLEPDNSKRYPPIGTAEMLGDESLHLHLHAETPDHKTHGDGDVTVAPGDKNYQSIRDHIGEIIPGQIKMVSPWLDKDGLPTNSGNRTRRSDVTGQDTTPKQTPTDTKADQTKPDQTKPLDVIKPEDASKPQDATQPQTQAQAKPPADVVVPASANFTADIDKTYNAMSPETRAIITQMGAKVVATHHLTDAMPELKGQAPRGWPVGATWDAVDGCYNGGKKEIIVAEERQSLANWPVIVSLPRL